MLKIIFILIALFIAIILVLAAIKSDSFHVERSIDIKAAPGRIFPFINDFHQWNEWTPYNKDPAMKKTFNGSASGKGAIYAWEGNTEVGRGEISITATTPPNKVELDLHMIKPFEGRNVVVFTLTTTGETTKVTWGMDGKQNFIVKVMGLFFSMDKMVGTDFDVGLARLKTVAEK
jgi:hypothetical protein